MHKRFARPWSVIALLLLVSIAPAVPAQTPYPSKPIRLVVPFPPAGSTDILGRALAQKLSERIGQQVIVDNRAGAGGSIGADIVAKAPADGYTLLMGHIGTLAVNPALYPKLAYDPLKDFAPVSLVAIVPNVMVVNPSVPAKNVAELIAYAQANPGKLTYSSGGNGSAAHLAMEYFKLQTKTEIVHVPYKGTAPAITDLIAGQVTMTMTGAPPVMPHIQSGRVRPIGVSSANRLDALPQVPTIAESGVPGFEALQWYGVVAPAGTPREIVARLARDIAQVMDTKEMKDRLAGEGAIAAADDAPNGRPEARREHLPIKTPEQFAAFIASEHKRWGAVVKAANMRPD